MMQLVAGDPSFSEVQAQSWGAISLAPLMTREAFAACVGLPATVLVAQAERGYWPQITIGKRVFINVEAVRAKALEHGQQFTF